MIFLGADVWLHFHLIGVIDRICHVSLYFRILFCQKKMSSTNDFMKFHQNRIYITMKFFWYKNKYYYYKFLCNMPTLLIIIYVNTWERSWNHFKKIDDDKSKLFFSFRTFKFKELIIFFFYLLNKKIIKALKEDLKHDKFFVTRYVLSTNKIIISIFITCPIGLLCKQFSSILVKF